MPMKTSEREYRDFTLAAQELNESEENQKMIVRGFASTFNQPYTLFKGDNLEIREQVAPGAFDAANLDDVILQYNHEGRVFARTSNNTLEVRQTEEGLEIEADLSGTEIGRQLYEEIRGGYTTKMSFGFRIAKDGDSWEHSKTEDGKDLEIRTINRFEKIYDVSAVSIPANDATSISVRDLSDGVIEQIKAERLKALELERKKLQTKIRLGGI